MTENLTDRARKVIQLARQEAQRDGHAMAGVGHVLLALVKEPGNVAGQALVRCYARTYVPANITVGIETVRQTMIAVIRAEHHKVVPQGHEATAEPGKMPLSPGCEEMLKTARNHAKTWDWDILLDQISAGYVTCEHLLLAMLQAFDETPATRVLTALGIGSGFAQVRTALTDEMKAMLTTPAGCDDKGCGNVLGTPVLDKVHQTLKAIGSLKAMEVETKTFDPEAAAKKWYGGVDGIMGDEGEAIADVGGLTPGRNDEAPHGFAAARSEVVTAELVKQAALVATCDIEVGADLRKAAEAFLIRQFQADEPTKPT